jgi:hypothetical protein
MNDLFAIIGMFAVGFAAGMYFCTQISKWIDKRIK